MNQDKIVKTFTSKKHNQVVFRYPTPDDLEDMLCCINELIREDTFIEMSGQELTHEEEQKFLSELLADIAADKRRFVVVEVNGQYGGSGEIRRLTYRKKHVGNLGIALLPAVRQEGIGTELLLTLLDEARTLGLMLVELNCFENNTRALRAYQKVGFKHAGMLPHAILYKGEYVGEVKMFKQL
jgi:RimJ/RimL family protein N-acetyltransferase